MRDGDGGPIIPPGCEIDAAKGAGDRSVKEMARAGCEKVNTGFSRKRRSKLCEAIRFLELGSKRSKLIGMYEYKV